jgi:hypothetical protein
MVKPDVREVIGRYSLAKRQIDVAVYCAKSMPYPFLVVESKRYSRRLNVKDIESFIGMKDDLGAQIGVVVCPNGFSPGAIRRAEAAGIITRVLSLTDAQRLNWREVARTIFPWDESSHPTIGDAHYVFDTSQNIWEWVEKLEGLPYEEWEATARSFEQIDASRWESMLRIIAQLHPDDGWRFNAIRLLEEKGALDTSFRDLLLQSEDDEEILLLLKDLNCNTE